MRMIEKPQILEKPTQEWLAVLEYICRSHEIRELMVRLEKEHGAYPQTDVKVEEEIEKEDTNYA